LHALAVDRDFNLVRVARGAGDINFEVVLSVEREVPADG